MDKIDKMLIRIIKNNGLDNYINESRKQGIPTPDGYGYDIFNFMNKFHYSIEQICQIWRDRGNLMWAGEMPVFNQKGKPIWTTQNIDLFEPIEEDTDADEGKSWPKSTYTSDQDLKVVYFTIILRNQAIIKNYRLGIESFWGTFPCEHNDDVSKFVVLKYSHMKELFFELIVNGFVDKLDFVVLKNFTGVEKPEIKDEFENGMDNIPWLTVISRNNEVIMRYKDSSKQ